MPLVLLTGSKLRIRILPSGETKWVKVDCEVDCSLNISGETLDATCKGEFFGVVEPGRSSGTGTINMIASDTKASNEVYILSKFIDTQLKRTSIKIEITETDDKGVVPTTNPVYVRGDAFITGNSWNFADHQFVDNSISFTFAGEIEHSS